jgi:hypothetical protein
MKAMNINPECPPNLIIRKPLVGAVLLALFGFGFTVLYRPLGTNPGHFLGYEATMAAYSLLAATGGFLVISLIRRNKKFYDPDNWNLFKELGSIIIILIGMGITAYFAAFLLEEPADRWNFRTFFHSISVVFLVGLLPFIFFTTMNLRFLFKGEQQVYQPQPSQVAVNDEQAINIESQLKKEDFSFMPSEFLYAEAEGNYVNFYLLKQGKVKQHMIRNSISNIQQQLSSTPLFYRTHRAFIVNLKKIRSKKGNSLGYRIKLDNVDEEIPVSRSNTAEFNLLLKNLLSED